MVPEFHFILFRFEVFASFSVFSHHFIFVSLQMRKNTFFASKRKKFRFRFASFCFEAKMMAVFALFSFCFHFISFLFRLRFLCFASMRNKRKFRIPFASFRFEAHPTSTHGFFELILLSMHDKYPGNSAIEFGVFFYPPEDFYSTVFGS
jgi:hypothetical protein